MTIVTKDKTHPFGDLYANAAGALPGANEAWVDGLRQTARAFLGADGFPTRRVEAWKYTSLNELKKTDFIPAGKADDIDVTALPVTAPVIDGAFKIVLANGVVRSDLSDDLSALPDGVSIEPLNTVLAKDAASLKNRLGGLVAGGASFIPALNTAYMEHGAVIRFRAQAGSDARIQLFSVGAAGARAVAFHPRLMVIADKGAKGTLVETHVGLPGQPYLTNPVSEVYVESGAELGHYIIVGEDGDAAHLGQTAVSAGEGSAYRSFTLSLGGHLVRREITVRLEEEGADVQVDGAYALTAAQHSDISSEVLHLVPDTHSSQVIKGVLGGKSHGVFQGRIHVARGAQRTDGRQLHKALLLNRGPEVDSKPELEIYADDVQCAHGAATGEMDHDHLFYLMSRGIDEHTARAMLVEGFLDDVIFNIADDAVQGMIHDMVKAWLARQTDLLTGASS
jgi:Fe-S cluster assembly protein SufD